MLEISSLYLWMLETPAVYFRNSCSICLDVGNIHVWMFVTSLVYVWMLEISSVFVWTSVIPAADYVRVLEISKVYVRML